MWEARKQAGLTVALRKESVDRNYEITHGAKNDKTSLSARRAWIEIRPLPCRALSPGSLSARRA